MALVAAWKLHSKNAPTSDRLPHINFRLEVTCGLLNGVPCRQAGGPTAQVSQLVHYDGTQNYLESTMQGRCIYYQSNTRKECGKCDKRLQQTSVVTTEPSQNREWVEQTRIKFAAEPSQSQECQTPMYVKETSEFVADVADAKPNQSQVMVNQISEFVAEAGQSQEYVKQTREVRLHCKTKSQVCQTD